MCVCFWSLEYVVCPNYELVGLQPWAVDNPNTISVHSPSSSSIPPKSKMHAIGEKNE